MLSKQERYLVFHEWGFNELMRYCNGFPNEITVCKSNDYFVDRLRSKGISTLYHRILNGHAIDRYIRTLCYEKNVDSDPEVIFHTKKMFPEYVYLFGEVGMVNKAIKNKQVQFVEECINSGMKTDIKLEEIHPIAHLLSIKLQEKLGYNSFFIDTGLFGVSDKSNRKNYYAGLNNMEPIFDIYDNDDREYYIIGYSRRKDTTGIWEKAKKLLNPNKEYPFLRYVLLIDRHYDYLPLINVFYNWIFIPALIDGDHHEYLDYYCKETEIDFKKIKRFSLKSCYIMSLEMWKVLVDYFDEDDLQSPLINGLVRNPDLRLLEHLTRRSYKLSEYINMFSQKRY